MTDPVAPQVAGYDVTGLLGAGSGGDVWLARERGTGEQVALKRVRPGAGLPARDRLRREAAALAGLTHPHVLRLRSVVGCLDTPDDLVLVLDAALGGSLARVVARQGPRPAGQVVTVLVAVADALAAVHRAGRVHGDVTPSNVLVTADGRPVLGDLGSARLAGRARWSGGASAQHETAAPADEPVGTPGFADPAGVGGPAADVHGLAATCVHLLTGRPPYDAAGARVPLGDVGRAADPAARRLVAVLDAALNPHPAQRPDAAGLARAAFDAAHPVPLTVDLLDGAVDGVADGTSWGVPITQLSAARWAGVVTAAVRSDETPDPVATVTHPAATPAHLRPAPDPLLTQRPRRRPRRRRGAHARPRPARTREPSWPFWRRSRLPARCGPAGSVLRRRGAAVLGTAVVVALAAVTGIAWAGAGPAASPGRDVSAPTAAVPSSWPATSSLGPATPTAATLSSGRSRTDGAVRVTPEHTWSARLRALDRTRSAAFAAGDADALDQVYATRSPALRRDRRAVRDLVAAGLRAVGVRLRAVDVRVVSTAGDQVRLAVTDELAAYRLLDARTGRVVERRPGRGTARWVLTLVRRPDGWRVWDVVRRRGRQTPRP